MTSSLPTGAKVLVLACASFVGTAFAQSAPPIKPGLWQMKFEREIDGQKAPDMGERMKHMRPEARERMEAAMKQHGIDASGGPGQMKLCMTRESLDQGQWQGQQERCKTEFTARGSSSWKWHSVCTQPPSETDAEASFTSPTSYTVKSSTQMTMRGQQRNTKTTIQATWLGADCGDLKPLSMPMRPKP